MFLHRVTPIGLLTLILLVLFSTASLAHAESVLWTTAGPEPTLLTIYDDGYYQNIFDPIISIEYHTSVFEVDANGAKISPLANNATVPIDTRVLFEFTPHVYSDIVWFGAGGHLGSPYGDWVPGAQPSTDNRCSEKNFYHRQDTPYPYDLFADLAVDPPEKALSFTGAPAECTLVNSGPDQICVLNASGSLNARFEFNPTLGKFYAGQQVRDLSQGTDSQCHVGNKPAAVHAYEYINFAQARQYYLTSPGYTLQVPTQDIPFTLHVTEAAENPDAHTPSVPSLSSAGACVVGTPHAINFVSTDPDGDDVRYGIDWDADGSVNEWVPPTGYVASGQSQSASRTYSIAGSKTVKVMAQDQGGLSSDWATLTFTCTETPPPLPAPTGQCSDATDNDNDGLIDSLDPDCTATNGFSEWPPEPPAGAPPGGSGANAAAILDLRVIPSLVKSGNTTKVHWSAQNVESCDVTAQNADAWTGTASPLGGNTSSPITSETLYTLSCTDLDGDAVTRSAKVRVIPGFQET